MAYDIRLAKLINGETVLGKWNTTANKIEDVAVLQTVPTQAGVQMMLLPFGYPFENEFGGEISLSHVLYEYKSFPEELKTKYLEATSNITLATPGSLSGLGGLGGMGGGMGGNVSDLSKLLKK
jgi:hypothetical protein